MRPFRPEGGVRFWQFLWILCSESKEWGAFEASRVVCVLEVDREAKEIVNVKVNDSARVDWDINN